jgi:hypothetical protein
MGAALLVVKIQPAYQDHKKTQEKLFQILRLIYMRQCMQFAIQI